MQSIHQDQEEEDHENLPSEERSIDLKPLIFEQEDKKYVTFNQVSKYSFQTIKGENEFYNSLLEVIVRNENYTFDLDHNKPREIIVN